MDIMMNSYDCYNKWKLDVSVFIQHVGRVLGQSLPF